jgi:hypothetical protein
MPLSRHPALDYLNRAIELTEMTPVATDVGTRPEFNNEQQMGKEECRSKDQETQRSL